MKFEYNEDKRIPLQFNQNDETIEISIIENSKQFLVSAKHEWLGVVFFTETISNELAAEAFYRTLKCFSFKNITQFQNLVIAFYEADKFSDTSFVLSMIKIQELENRDFRIKDISDPEHKTPLKVLLKSVEVKAFDTGSTDIIKTKLFIKEMLAMDMLGGIAGEIFVETQYEEKMKSNVKSFSKHGTKYTTGWCNGCLGSGYIVKSKRAFLQAKKFTDTSPFPIVDTRQYEEICEICNGSKKKDYAGEHSYNETIAPTHTEIKHYYKYHFKAFSYKNPKETLQFYADPEEVKNYENSPSEVKRRNIEQCNHSWEFSHKGIDKTYPRIHYKCRKCSIYGCAEYSGASIVAR